MTKKEVLNLIYSLTSPHLVYKGFVLKRGIDGGFFRSILEGSQYIGVPIIDYKPVFKFSIVIAVRLDVVEEIANKFNAAPAKYHAGTTTFISTLERFMPGGDTQVVASTGDDIRAGIARITPVIQERIIPFLDETQNLQTVARAMSLLDVPELISSPGSAMRAIIVAKLSNHPDFEAIVATYQQRISHYPKQTQEDFEKFIHYVRELTTG